MRLGHSPERCTRLDLLRQKTLLPDREPLPAEVLEFLAEQLRGNVRELEGALNSVWHFARAHGSDALISSWPAKHSAMSCAIPFAWFNWPMSKRPFARRLSLDAGTLQSKKRSWMVSHPRMLAMFLARKHTSATYTEIGHRFGGRNHSTAVAGEKKVRLWLKENTPLQTGPAPVPVRDVIERMERELLK